MINSPGEIKEQQLRALVKLFRELLGFRLHRQAYQLHDVLEAMKKQGIKTAAFNLLIVFDTHCVANITKYENHKRKNPLVWFFYFGLEEQPMYTIDYFYRLFFKDNRFLQPSTTIQLNIDYEQTSNQNRIRKNRANSLCYPKGRKRIGVGYNKGRKPNRID